MNQIPQNIPNEVIRGYSGRFVVYKLELERLVNDISTRLRDDKESSYVRINFLVGLKNGVTYETTDINIVFQEENAQSLKMVLLVISGEAFTGSGEIEKRIIVYFSRGQMNRAWDYVAMSNGYRFNISANGMGYLVRENNRQSALDIIDNIEERLKKFRRFYSNFPEMNLNISNLLASAFIYVLLGTVFYFLIWSSWYFVGLFPDIWNQWLVFPKFTDPLLASIIFVYLFTIFGVILAYILGKVFLWFVPPSMIEIGDEVENYKKQNNLRQAVFWTIIVGGIVGIIVNIIT